MINFNIKRFGRLLWCDLVGNKKKNLRIFAVLVMTCMLVFVFSLLKHHIYGHAGYVGMSIEDWECMVIHNAIGPLMFVFFFLVLVIAPGQACKHLSTKQKRIAALMLPATNLEKYLSRFVLVTIFLPLAFLLAVIVADCLRMLVFPIFGHALPAVFPGFFARLGDTLVDNARLLTLEPFPIAMDNGIVLYSVPSVFMLLLGVGGLLLFHSIFMLGSSLFRRFAALFTMLILVGLMILSGLLVPEDCDIEAKLNPEVVIYCTTGVTWILALVCYYFSYRIFTRIQVIPRKLLRK